MVCGPPFRILSTSQAAITDLPVPCPELTAMRIGATPAVFHADGAAANGGARAPLPRAFRGRRTPAFLDHVMGVSRVMGSPRFSIV